nr:hypothetical protein [Tanacetum cinerariifolium]
MSSLFADTHNVVAILEKSDAAKGFEQIIDFLSGSYIHYALIVNPYIYISCIKQFWNTTSVKRSDDVTRLQALVDRKKILILEAVIHKILQLDDAEGVVCLPNEEIFAGLAQMGYKNPSTKLTFYNAFFSNQWKFLIHTLLQSLSAKRTSWNEFSTAMASAVICLSKGQKFNFSKYIFDSLVCNVDSSSKFNMYPRFIQLIIQNQVDDLSTHTTRYISPALTQKVFANMGRVGKGFSGVEIPLFEGMLVARQLAEEGIAEEQVQVDVVVAAAIQENVAEDVSNDVIPSPPSHDILSPSQEQSSPPQQPQSSPQAPPQGAKFPIHIQQILNVCSALTRRVKNFKHDKAAQKLEIIKLKARVQRLERSNKVKSSKLRRLRKVGAFKRIESSDDIEDVFNQGRMIDDLDKDEGIELVVTTAKLITDVVTAASQVSAASATISTTKPSIPAAVPTVVAAYTRRRKGVIIRDPKEELSSKTPAETPKLKDKGKGVLIETPKPMKKKDQIELDAEYARKLHEEINKDIDWDAAIDHVNQKSKNPQYIKRYQGMKKRPQTETQKAAKRRKLNEEAQEDEDLKKRLEVVDDKDDDVFIEATPLVRKKSDAAEGFEQIIDFLNDVTRLQALVDKKKIVLSENVIHEILQLDDAEGVVCLPNEEIFTGLAQMGYEKPFTKLTFYKAFFSSQWKFLIHTILQSLSAKRTSWNEFSTTMASANQVGDLSTHTRRFISPALTQKVFANMRRVGKGFSRVETPLFEGMLAVRQAAKEGIAEAQVQADDVVAAVEEHVAEDGEQFPTHIQQILDVCLALTRRVENLEHDNAAQKLEIIKLQVRVKRLERANKVKPSKLRRLKKVGASRRVESADDIEDVFNQEMMIDDMDKDKGIELAQIYNLDLDHSSKVLSMQEDDSEVQEVVEVVTTAKLITDVVTTASQVSAASATISTAKLSIPAAAPTVVAAYTRRRKEGMKKRPQTESKARKNMMIYLKNTTGYKMDFFKGITYDEICPIFQASFTTLLKNFDREDLENL